MNLESYSNLENALSHCLIHDKDIIINELKQKLYSEKIKNIKLHQKFKSLIEFCETENTYYVKDTKELKWLCTLCNKWVCSGVSCCIFKVKKLQDNKYRLSYHKLCSECANNDILYHFAFNKFKCSYWLDSISIKWRRHLDNILYKERTGNPLSYYNTRLVAALIIQNAYKRNWSTDNFIEIYESSESDYDEVETHVVTNHSYESDNDQSLSSSELSELNNST